MYDIENLCNKYYNTVFKYLISITHNIDLSEELTQETFCIAIKEIDKFNGKCTVSTWLCIIAKHLYYKEIKKIKKFKISELSEKDIQEISFEENYISNQEKIELYKKLQRLDEHKRNVIYLRLLGFSFKEIAEITGKTEIWAKVSYHRGKKELTEMFEGGEKDEK